MELFAKFLNKTITTFNIKGIEIEARYWQAITIVFLLFLLLFTLARLRYLYVDWHLSKSSISFLFYGFLLALILEGFLVLSGRTFMTEILGWKDPPKPISTALDMGREKLVDVLGEQSQVPSSQASDKPTLQSVLSDFNELSSEDSQLVRDSLCKLQ